MEENSEDLSIIEQLEDMGIVLNSRDQRYIAFSILSGIYNKKSFIKRINYLPILLEHMIPEPEFTQQELAQRLYAIEIGIRAIRKLLESKDISLLREVKDIFINSINEIKEDKKINSENIELLFQKLNSEFSILFDKLQTSNDPNIIEGFQLIQSLIKEYIQIEMITGDVNDKEK